MGQGLKGAPHTYSQLSDLTFGPLPRTHSSPPFPTLITDAGDYGMAPYMDDHAMAAAGFEAMFDFLHTKYFPRVAWAPIPLAPHKANFFCSHMEL